MCVWLLIYMTHYKCLKIALCEKQKFTKMLLGRRSSQISVSLNMEEAWWWVLDTNSMSFCKLNPLCMFPQTDSFLSIFFLIIFMHCCFLRPSPAKELTPGFSICVVLSPKWEVKLGSYVDLWHFNGKSLLIEKVSYQMKQTRCVAV